MQTIEEINAQHRRQERDFLLRSKVDAMNFMRWDSLTPEQQFAWKQYRQDLLDITKQNGFPFNVVWPMCPDDIATSDETPKV